MAKTESKPTTNVIFHVMLCPAFSLHIVPLALSLFRHHIEERAVTTIRYSPDAALMSYWRNDWWDEWLFCVTVLCTCNLAAYCSVRVSSYPGKPPEKRVGTLFVSCLLLLGKSLPVTSVLGHDLSLCPRWPLEILQGGRRVNEVKTIIGV